MTSPNLKFEIVWLAPFGERWQLQASAAVMARETIHRRDLTAAITCACNKLRSGKGNAKHAHGFVVRSLERGN
jgi:hypothetical protein